MAPLPNAAPPAGRPARGPVRRRHVLYLSGFDPQGPSHYHALYAEQAALQAQVSRYRLTVGPRERAGPNAAWDIEWCAADDGASVHTRYEFLRWDDIVRAHWPRGQWRLLGVTLATTARLLVNGSLWRILQTSWPAFLALTLPAALLLACVGGVFVLGAAGTLLAGVAGTWVGGAVFVLGCAGLAAWARRAQARVQMAWLMRSASVVLRQARDGLPELQARLDSFAAQLCECAARPDVDEVLVVGHSSGAMLAASVVARALELDAALLRHRASVALLTLGQCIPLLSYQAEAVGFRRELARLRGTAKLTWIDVTAPPDGCCFALVDPTEVCEDGRPDTERTLAGPKRVSPRFARCFSPETYRAVRRDKYRCHFQYLMAVERPGNYDYFEISAGPQRLSERFAAQPGVASFTDFQCLGGPRR